MKKSELKQLIKEEIEKVLNEAKKTFKLKIINKSGPATIQQVSVDTGTTELFDIVALIKKSPKVKDVEILDEEVKEVVKEVDVSGSDTIKLTKKELVTFMEDVEQGVGSWSDTSYRICRFIGIDPTQGL
jgi:hypothetical protein